MLRYPRLQRLYALTEGELYDYAQFLRDVGETVLLDRLYHLYHDSNDLDVMQTAERGEADLSVHTTVTSTMLAWSHFAGRAVLRFAMKSNSWRVLPGASHENQWFTRAGPLGLTPQPFMHKHL